MNSTRYQRGWMARREGLGVVVLVKKDAKMVECNAKVTEIVASEPQDEVKMSY
jgi:hypothetical protein